MAFERYTNNTQGVDTIPDRILKIDGYREDKEGNIIKGDYPKDYLRKLNAYLSTPGILAVKSQKDINWDFMSIRNILRIGRDTTPDEQYEIIDMVDELNAEAAALGNITRTKEGKYNLAFNSTAAISVNESTTTTKDQTQQNKGGLFGSLFRRKVQQ